MERVLAWIKPRVPFVEQEQLLHHIQQVTPDNLLSQLLTTWLQPPVTSCGSAAFGCSASAGGSCSSASLSDLNAAGEAYIPGSGSYVADCASRDAACGDVVMDEILPCCGRPRRCHNPAPPLTLAQTMPGGNAATSCPFPAITVEVVLDSQQQQQPPLRGIIHFHTAIMTALQDFALEARSLLSVSGQADNIDLGSRERFVTHCLALLRHLQHSYPLAVSNETTFTHVRGTDYLQRSAY